MCIRDRSATAELKDLEVNCTLQPDIKLKGDRVLIEIALHNLLDNAIKYSAPDSTISIELNENSKHTLFTVKDTGRGIDGADQSSLAKRFQRGDNAKDVVGSGLGLTMVEAIAKAHQGHFSIAANKGVGTCVTLQL